MRGQLTKEQLMIQTMAREFSRQVVLRDAAERDRTKAFPAEVLKRMGELGLMGMRVPEAYNGQGTDMVSYVLALSEIAYACAATAVIMAVHNSIVCESIAVYGTQCQKERFLPALATGDTIGAFALTEPQAGSDPLGQETCARKENGCYVLNGTKRFITSGKNGGLVIVTAKTDPAKGHRGISAFLVPRETAGLSVGRVEDKLGLRASDTVDLLFDECRVPEDHLLGGEGEGFKIAMTALDGGRIGIAAQALGVAQAAFDEAVRYAQGREQFGRKISGFQSLRFTLADMATEIEAARQLMLLAATLKDQGRRVTREAAMAKLYASEMANRVTARALQIHGGYGVIKEYPVERFYRDARVFTIYEGTSEIQRMVISNLLLKDKGE